MCRNKEKRKALPGDDEDEGDSNNSSTPAEFSLLSSPSNFSSFFSVRSPLLLLFVCLLIDYSLFSALFFSVPLLWRPDALFIGARIHWLFPVRLFFPWHRISLAGTWIWDSILISLGVYLHVGIFLKNRVLGGLGYRQSCPGWAVGGDLLHVVGTSWRRWTWG